MKTKTNNTHSLGISAFLLACTVLLLSCGGCRSGKVAKSLDTSLSDKVSDTAVTQDHGSSLDTIDKVVYVNDSTHTYKDITITNYYVANTRLIKFPEGKTLSDAIDNPIIKEIPKKYIVDWDHIKSSPTYGVIDIKAMDMKTKKRWFSKMDGLGDINNLMQGVYYGGLDTRFMDKGIILKFTFIEVEEKIVLSADEWKQAYVGSVAVIEGYDLKGNKMYEINLDKYGGRPICITGDNKYLITYSQGKDEGQDRTIYKNANLSIYYLSDGKLFNTFLLPDYSNEPGCGKHDVGLSVINSDLDSVLRINIVIEKKIIKTLNFHQSNFYNLLGSNEDGDFIFKDGTVISNGSVGFNQYTFDEWNKLMSKKEMIYD